MPNRPIPSSPEYAERKLADDIEICPNCKGGIIWDRGFVRYCRLCGIEGADLVGIAFQRAKEPKYHEYQATPTKTAEVQGDLAPIWNPLPVSHRGDADRFIR